ncbi:histidine phosphatase family protein [Gorillibacterium sp. CAU 1737]|uniref:histidine phosphatase family protein n=1 Tax=Gorillibacterium sp. CAU 1737 TaxID=3140362 RepID=UPI00325FF796
MVTFGFIRHGLTDWNAEYRAQGQHDVPLNAEGLRQARLLGARLANESWDYLYTSDLSRARVTAEIAAEAMGMEVTGSDPRLREKSHGRLDGTTVADRIAAWGEDWAKLDHGEESVESILARSMDFLKEKAAEHPDKRILIVSHGAWIARTIEHLLQVEDIPHIGNTYLCVLNGGDNEGWSCTLPPCAKHLDVSAETSEDSASC